MDIANTNYNSHTVSILLGNSSGMFQFIAFIILEITPPGIAVGNFNDDGSLDIVTLIMDRLQFQC
ncbi:MAG: hypothetical protein MRQ09_04955 [Candidatus Midichloria sp.]|nr:hypothetical protein [Candidatus Midichloria sp.]